MLHKNTRKNRKRGHHKRSSHHKRGSLHKRSRHHKRRGKTAKNKTRKSHLKKHRKHRKKTQNVQNGGCGQCLQGSPMFKSNPAPFQGPASMTGEASPGSNHYAKLQNPTLPNPKSIKGGNMTSQKGGGILGPNTLYNMGLGGLQSGWWNTSNAVKNAYYQWNGEKPVASASSMDQPIDNKTKIIAYNPPNVSQIYDNGAKQAAEYSLGNK